MKMKFVFNNYLREYIAPALAVKPIQDLFNWNSALFSFGAYGGFLEKL